MTKTKIGVEIHKNGDRNDLILKAVANHNAGLFAITRKDIIGFLNINRAMFPTLSSSRYICKSESYTLHISEDDGETFTLTLTWKEVHELNENDLESVIPMDEVTNEIESELLKNRQ